MRRIVIVLVVCAGLAFLAGYLLWRSTPKIPEPQNPVISGAFDSTKDRPDREWKRMLTDEQFRILREKGTETPFSGELNKEDRPGTYYSAGCDEAVFRSEQKYDSNTGWPSFWAPIDDDALVLQEDNANPFDKKIEVLDVCGGHLGHVFDDGPQPSGKRYCINSAALYFIPD